MPSRPGTTLALVSLAMLIVSLATSVVVARPALGRSGFAQGLRSEPDRNIRRRFLDCKPYRCRGCLQRPPRVSTLALLVEVHPDVRTG